MDSSFLKRRVGRITLIATYSVISIAVGYWAAWEMLAKGRFAVAALVGLAVLFGYSVISVFLRRTQGTMHTVDDKSTTAPLPPSS